MTAVKKRNITLVLVLALLLSMALLSPAQAWADGEITSIGVRLSQVPVYTNGVYSATVTIDNADVCTMVSYGWYDVNGAPADGTFGRDPYRMEITLQANEGYYFSPSVAVTLDGTAPEYSVAADGSSVFLARSFTPQVWSPQVIKSPTNETVKVGEMAPFNARANYADTYEWIATSPDGKTQVNCQDLPSLFPGVTIGGDGKEKMNIRNVPAEMNGWLVKCVFTGAGGSASSHSATITVKTPATPSPSPTVKPSPSPSPTAKPSASPSPSPEAQHSHQFSPQWSMDELEHWHECSCGEKADLAEHSMEWEPVKSSADKGPKLEEGRCSVCGYSSTREAEDKGGISTMGYLFIGILVLILIIVAGILISSLNQRRHRHHRPSHSKHGKH